MGKQIRAVRIVLAVLLTGVLLGFTAGAQASNGVGQNEAVRLQDGVVPRFEEGDCPGAVQERIPPGEDVTCGTLVVPERYEELEGDTIQLGVVIIPAVTQTVAQDPVVFAQGGPGGSTIEYYSQVLFTARIRVNRDFVLFDQRGTMYSQPSLFCQEIFDETIRLLPLDVTVEESNRLFNQAALACRKRLADEGVDLSAYNSVENARDIESLRQALGYPKINLYGVSYGTLLALHAMREAPQALRSVILDAVVPTTIDFNFNSPNTQDRAFSELFKACQNDPDCAASYPDLEKRFFTLVDRLNDKPVMIRLNDPDTGKSYDALINGDALVSGVVQMLYMTDVIPLLPKMIHNAEVGRFTFLESIFSLITFDRTMNYGMYFSVVCSEDGTSDPGYSYAGVREELAKDAKLENQATVELCSDWKVDQLGPSADEAVISDIPTLLFSGNFDPITPPEYAAEAASSLSRAYSFVFPNTGHGALTSSACADAIFLEFLSNPERQPDGSCLEEQSGVKFLTDRDVIDLPLMLNIASMPAAFLTQVGILGAAVLLLLSAAVVFPLAWIIRRGRAKPQRETPLLVYLASWLPAMNGGVLVTLAGALFAVVVILVTNDEVTPLYFGLPARYGPLLVLGFLSLALTAGMGIYAVAGWAGKYWSLRRKIYYSVLALAALASAVLLGMWGLFTFWL